MMPKVNVLYTFLRFVWEIWCPLQEETSKFVLYLVESWITWES